MVATIKALGPSQATVHYFERDGYYAKNDPEHRRASFWHGSLARELGLRGHVRPKRFEQVLGGFVPGTNIQLGRVRDGERQHHPGLDLTSSAPKSVSVMALVFGDVRLLRAHDVANREMLDWAEREVLETRGYDPATGRRPRVRAHGMLVAGFRHLTSRGQDPQVHTHNAIPNMTRNVRGEWRSLETTRFRRSEKLLGAIYRNALAREVQALGYAIAPTMVGRFPGFEIAGFERADLDAYSGRRRQVLEWLESNGLPYTAELAQKAALLTRPPKEDISLDELIPIWRARARGIGLVVDEALVRPPRPLDPATGRASPRVRVKRPAIPRSELRARRRAPALPALTPWEGSVAEAEEKPGFGRRTRTAPRAGRSRRVGAPSTLSPEPERGVLEAVAWAAAHIEERTAVFAETELQALALGHAPGRYTLGEINAAIARLCRGGELLEAKRRGVDRAFVTARAVRSEGRIRKTMREGQGRGRAFCEVARVEAALGTMQLTEGQRAAVRLVALSRDWLVGVQGHAGAGKTTMLREAAGLPDLPAVKGLAPSASAVRVLEREAGIESRTLQWFLARFSDLSDPAHVAWGRKAYARTVLAVDEASMIGTAQMERLLGIARALGIARVVLVGDTRQLRAVDAGQPFRVLQKAGMATAVMHEVVRQRDPGLLAAVNDAREGDPALAIERLGERVVETDREALGRAAGRIWLALPDADRARTAVLAPTHAIRREINETVREGLGREGVLHGRTLRVSRLIDRRLTRALAADIRCYEPGDTVVFHRDAYGCRAGDVCQVTGAGDGWVRLSHPDGVPRRFRPSGNAARNLGLFDTADIELRAGDRIRWTRNRKAPRARFGRPRAPDLVNGDTADVLSIGPWRVQLRTEHGERLSLRRKDPHLRHLDHAYSSTVHAAQGRTAPSVIAVLESGWMSDRTQFYVELSRASEEFLLLTDDREALGWTLSNRPGLEEGALEAIGLDPGASPVVELELFEALRDDWRALRERCEARGEAPYFAEGYPGVMARAAALSAIEELPEGMRGFTAALIEEHQGHLERDEALHRLIARMHSLAREWPELGWMASAGGGTVEELPRHGDWRAEANHTLETARAWLGDDAGRGRHLDAMPGGRAGLEAAVRDLVRVRTRDGFRAFERRLARARERAAREGVPAVDVEGYAEVEARGAALAGEELTAPERTTLDEWRSRHDEETGLRYAMEDFVRGVEELGHARHELGFGGDSDFENDEYHAWRLDAAELLTLGRATLAPHLPAHPERRARVVREAAALERILRSDGYRAFALLYRDVEARAEASGAAAFYTPRFGELVARAGRLSLDPTLPPDTRRLADACLAHDRTSRRRRAEIEGFPREVRALLAGGVAATRGWKGGDALIETGRSLLGNPEEYRHHLDAMPGARSRIAQALVSLHRALPAGPEPALPDAPYIVPCRGRVVSGDRIRWTVTPRSREEVGIGGDNPRLEAVVERVFAFGDPHFDLVDVRIGSCSSEHGPAPGSSEWLRMSTLFDGGCFRMPWDDEDERARTEAREYGGLVDRASLERSRGRRRDHDRGEDHGINM